MKSSYIRELISIINLLFFLLVSSCESEPERRLPPIPLDTPQLFYTSGTQSCITYIPDQTQTAVQSECSGAGNVEFVISKVDEGFFNIKTPTGNLCLEVQDDRMENGADLQFAPCTGRDNQLISFVTSSLDFKYLKISFAHSGKCIDIPEQSRLPGTKLIQWECHSGPTQDILIAKRRKDNALLPRIIWTFWDNPASFPAFYKANIKHWRSVLNDSAESWEVRVLNNVKGDENYFGNFIDESALPTMAILKSKIGTADFEGKLDSRVIFSDFVRLEVLYNYGGVWLDPSVMLHRDLSPAEFALQIFDGFSFAGYTNRNQATYELRYADSLENWYFASLPKTEFLKVFKTNFRKYWDYKTPGMSIRDNPLFNGSSGPIVDVSRFHELADYLNQHITLKYTLMTNPAFLDEMFVIGGSDLDERGPFSLLQLACTDEGCWKDSVLVNLTPPEIDTLINRMLWVPMSKFPSDNSRAIRAHTDEEYFFDTKNIFGRLNAIPG